MSNNHITTHYKCDKCNKQYEFTDIKNKSGLRLYRCKHFVLKFIRNTDDGELKYILSLKCLQCSKKKGKQNINIDKNSNKNNKNLNYSTFNCCGNTINIAAFFLENENQSNNENNSQGQEKTEDKLLINNKLIKK